MRSPHSSQLNILEKLKDEHYKGRLLTISDSEHSDLIDCTAAIISGSHMRWDLISRLRAIKTIKKQIQWQSQRLIFFQCTIYRNPLGSLWFHEFKYWFEALFSRSIDTINHMT